jgi:hypothetical protein
MAKGGNYEREICHSLSKWWTGNENDSVFWRTANSGGRATVRGRKGKKTSGHCGDICATDQSAEPFMKLVTIEVKRGYNKDNVFNFIDQKRGKKATDFEQWILQAKSASERAGSMHWMVIARRNQKVAMVYFPTALFDLLEDHFEIVPRPLIEVRVWIRDGKKDKRFNFVGMKLEDFLDNVSPKDIRKIVRSTGNGRTS